MVQDKIIKKDCITMDLPTNPEYVSVARLTVSAISNTIGFNVEEIEDIKRKIELKEIEVPDSSTSLETFLNTKDKEWDEQKWNFRLHRFNAELDMDRKCSELWYYVQTGRMKMGSDERCTCVWI